jgi:hypothetical protein
VVEGVHRARESALLVVGVRWSGDIRQEDLRLAQGISSLMHRNGIFPRDGFSAYSRYQCPLHRTAYGRERPRYRSPYRFHGHDRRLKRRGIQAARERRAAFGQNALHQSSEAVDERHQDHDADDIVCGVIGGQQRHAVNRLRSTDEQGSNKGKKHQCNHGSDHLEQHVPNGQPLGGGARADSRQCRTGGRSDVLPDDQRATLVKPDCAGVIGRQRHRDGRR